MVVCGNNLYPLDYHKFHQIATIFYGNLVEVVYYHKLPQYFCGNLVDFQNNPLLYKNTTVHESYGASLKETTIQPVKLKVL